MDSAPEAKPICILLAIIIIRKDHELPAIQVLSSIKKRPVFSFPGILAGKAIRCLDDLLNARSLFNDKIHFIALGISVIKKILHGTPQVEGKDFSKYIERHPKLWIAKKKGAAGLLLLQGAVVSGNGDYVEGLPMAMVGEKVWQGLFASRGYNFENVRALCQDGHHLSFSTGVKARLKSRGVPHDSAETFNVVGMIEGRDPVLKQEYIIFGGHLDGIGPWPVLHPGANDNASGSAVVMALAQAFSRLKTPPKRTLVFALFSGEELGLLGSKHMAAQSLKTYHL